MLTATSKWPFPQSMAMVVSVATTTLRLQMISSIMRAFHICSSTTCLLQLKLQTTVTTFGLMVSVSLHAQTAITRTFPALHKVIMMFLTAQLETMVTLLTRVSATVCLRTWREANKLNGIISTTPTRATTQLSSCLMCIVKNG